MSDHKPKKRHIIKSFRAAFDGIFHAFRKEGHMQFHTLAAVGVIVLAWILDVSINDWIVLILLIALVMAFELVNTAVERVVDLITKDNHPLAKQAKDVAAGAVLIMAIASVIIGLCIFLKYL